MAIGDAEGKPVQFNRALQEMLGYTEREVEGMVYTDFTHPDDVKESVRLLGELLSGKRDYFRMEKRYYRKDGSLVWASMVASAFRHTEGKRRYVAMIEDISERKRMEEALGESEERFRSAFEHTAVGMALVSPDGRFLQVNRSLSDILGYSPEEMTSTRWQVTTHPDDIEITQSHMRRLLAGEIDSCHFQRRCLHKRGHEVWSLLSLSLVRHADGTPLYFISQLQDISERKRAEKALRESEERFRSAFEHAAIGMAVVGTEGHFLQVNGSLCEMLGYSQEELKSTTWQAITHPDDLDVGLDTMSRTLAGEIESGQFEKRYFHMLGHEVWGLLSFSLVRDADGTPLYFISQIQDISERKRMEEQLQSAREELEGKVERQMLRRNQYRLTFRELTVLHLVGAGRSDKEIGTELGISPLTAQKHVSNILTKMDAASRTEAGMRALREGLLD